MDWAWLQWLDSAFPSGGYAHSLGLEAWSQLAPDDADVDLALHGVVRSQLQLQAPFVRRAHAEDALHHPSTRAALHAALDAHLWGEVQRRASLVQGRALLEATLRSTAPHHLVQSSSSWSRELHHAIAFGALARGFTEHTESAVVGFGFVTARAVVSAAVRLNLIGPFAGQRLLGSLEDSVRATLASREPPASASPYLDLLAEQHDRLHTRLFSS